MHAFASEFFLIVSFCHVPLGTVGRQPPNLVIAAPAFLHCISCSLLLFDFSHQILSYFFSILVSYVKGFCRGQCFMFGK